MVFGPLGSYYLLRSFASDGTCFGLGTYLTTIQISLCLGNCAKESPCSSERNSSSWQSSRNIGQMAYFSFQVQAKLKEIFTEHLTYSENGASIERLNFIMKALHFESLKISSYLKCRSCLLQKYRLVQFKKLPQSLLFSLLAFLYVSSHDASRANFF